MPRTDRLRTGRLPSSSNTAEPRLSDQSLPKLCVPAMPVVSLVWAMAPTAANCVAIAKGKDVADSWLLYHEWMAWLVVSGPHAKDGPCDMN